MSTRTLLLFGLFLTSTRVFAQTLPQRDFIPDTIKGSDGVTLFIELHQTICVIAEAEPDALPYSAKSAADCARINRATEKMRRAEMGRMRLLPGPYIFRVFNEAVPWPVGFHLRGADDPSLPQIKGESIGKGQRRDFVIELPPGRYVYSGQGNSPDYPLLIER